MRTPTCARWYVTWLAAGLASGALTAVSAGPPDGGSVPTAPAAPQPEPTLPPPQSAAAPAKPPADDPESVANLLGPDVQPIDLDSALNLAGVRNPEMLLARQLVVEAVALRQLAALQILPNLNYGVSYDAHTGPVQQSSGNILKVHREAVYFGAGAKAIAAGTVTIPGVALIGNPAEGIFAFLVARQEVAVRQFANRAVANQMFLRVGLAYTDLLRAQGRRSLALLTRNEAREVVRLTAAWAKGGLGRKADADRAASELAHRVADVRETEGEVLIASARLAQLLNLDPSLLLEAAEVTVLPAPVVPDVIPMCELLAIALVNRPEMQQRRAQIQEALLALRGARILPFSPNVILGFSSGEEAGGSDLATLSPTVSPFGRGQARFGRTSPRLDFDVVGYWMLRNGGLGNVAQIRELRSLTGVADLELLATMDRVRAEVADAYVRTHARFAEIETSEQAVSAGRQSFDEDTARIRGNQGLPIELLNSLEILARARYEYLRAIVDYNQAQLELYVALGQPPANTLARPVPADYVPSEEAKRAAQEEQEAEKRQAK
jgi:outer membrane protein TolC